MAKKRRSRRFQYGSLCESPDGKRWIVKFYYVPGKQTTKTLEPKTQITRRQAEMMRDELVRPLNESPFRSLGNDTFEKFVEDVFLPMKRESGEWRENTGKESTREIRLHLVSELGDVQFEELTPALLRAVLKKKAEQGLRRQTLNHLKGYLSDICKRATAEGYLETNVSEGLRAPFKLAKPADARSLGPDLHRLCADCLVVLLFKFVGLS